MRSHGLSWGVGSAEEEECDLGTEGHHLQKMFQAHPLLSVSAVFPRDLSLIILLRSGSSKQKNHLKPFSQIGFSEIQIRPCRSPV